jgi:SAM-dependent methyltransferase
MQIEWPAEKLAPVAECPYCKSPGRDVLHHELADVTFRIAPGKWQMVQCRACGAGYLDPRPTQDSIHEAYAGYYTHGPAGSGDSGPRSGVKTLLRNGYLNREYGYRLRPALSLGHAIYRRNPYARAWVDKTYRSLPAPRLGDRLLDVGCGNGYFLKIAAWLGWQCVGLDFDPKAIEAATRDGAEAYVGTVPGAPFPPESFAAITLSHVIEHVPDPAETIAGCAALLQPGGMLWLAAPNIEAAGHHEFGRSWRGLECPRHLAVPSFRSLERSVEKSGLRVSSRLGGPIASYTWPTSYHIRAGRSMEDPGPVPGDILHRLSDADRRGLRVPEHAEEVVITAVK